MTAETSPDPQPGGRSSKTRHWLITFMYRKIVSGNSCSVEFGRNLAVLMVTALATCLQYSWLPYSAQNNEAQNELFWLLLQLIFKKITSQYYKFQYRFSHLQNSNQQKLLSKGVSLVLEASPSMCRIPARFFYALLLPRAPGGVWTSALSANCKVRFKLETRFQHFYFCHHRRFWKRCVTSWLLNFLWEERML